MCKIFHPFVITVITVIVIARWCLLLHSFLLSKACGAATRHLYEFFFYSVGFTTALHSINCLVVSPL